MTRFSGRVCIVAGGARGIGATTARSFLEQGGSVCVADLNEELGRELEKELGQERVSFVPLDVTDAKSCERAVRQAVEAFGRVDYLVNSAIQMAPGPLAELPPESWRRVVDVGLTGTFLMCRAVGRELMRRGEGAPS